MELPATPVETSFGLASVTIHNTPPRTPWSPPTKTRVYCADVTPTPTMPECADPTCESYSCRTAHAQALMIAMTGKRTPLWEGDDRNRCGAEADHRLWKAHRRVGIANMRKLLTEVGVIDEVGSITFSNKAGCGCGCSPGFVAANDRGRSISVRVEGY